MLIIKKQKGVYLQLKLNIRIIDKWKKPKLIYYSWKMKNLM